MMILQTTHDDYAALILGKAPRSLILADTPIAPVEVLQMLAGVATQVRETFSPVSWLIAENNELVGLCSITRPPHAGEIDIGYGIAPSRQNRGIAGRAIGEIVLWARSTAGLNAITAETSVADTPSQQVLRRNGFTEVGERVDEEDGPLLCWRCATD